MGLEEKAKGEGVAIGGQGELRAPLMEEIQLCVDPGLPSPPLF